MKNIKLTDKFLKRFNYENKVNDEIYILTLQSKLKNIIITIVSLRLIITRNVIKTLNLKNKNKIIIS